MSDTMKNSLDKHNDFDNICNNSVKKPKSNGLMDFFKSHNFKW